MNTTRSDVPADRPEAKLPLTRRQAQIAQMVIRAQSNGEIARTLSLSERTVEKHVARIFDRLGVHSRIELIALLERPAQPARLPAAATPLRTNLPRQRTRLVGRSAAIDEIARLLDDAALVTITGTGGVGKTRVATAVGEALANHTPHGVWFVELAPLAPGSAPAPAIAQALAIPESANMPLIETLVAHLASKTLVLVLDNCEHIVAEAAAAADTLLRGCPQVKILATSREPLRVDGERTYLLPSLDLATGVELFAQCATGRDRTFALTDQSAPAVARICRELDGIPLAIELAAARVNALGITALAANLDGRLRILDAPSRTAVPRQRTMRAVLDWSYDLLEPPEQRFFERLAVFAGGWNLAAATTIAADVDDELGVLSLLASLVDKSLVIADVSGDEPRYAMLEATRRYALERLAARGEAVLVAHRHALAYVERAERFERSAGTALEPQWKREERELDNWRAALSWTLQSGGDVVLGQRLLGALGTMWGQISLVEGRRWYTIALALVDERTPARVRAQLELRAAAISLGLGEWEAALAAAERLGPAFSALGHAPSVASARYIAGVAHLCLGRVSEAEPLLAAALDACRSAGDRYGVAKALDNLAYAASMRGDLDACRASIDEACGVWTALGFESAAVNSMLILAEAEYRAGHTERAIDLVLPAIETLRRAWRQRSLTPALLNAAAYLIACDRWDDARAAAQEALRQSVDTQRRVWPAWAIQHLAAIAVLSANGAPSEAMERAARLIGYVDARISEWGSPREHTEQLEYDRVQAALLAALGSAGVERCAAQGALLTPAHAAAEAAALAR